MNTPTNLPLTTKRTADTWLKRDGASTEQFIKEISRTTELADWPLASDCQKNVLIYDGDAVRQADRNPQMREALTAEWAHVFRSGPGVLVIKNALADHEVIDKATQVFDRIINEQHASGSGGADHFAKPGANDRIWNALEKHCLADPENFAQYFSSSAIALASTAWLGPGYQVTAQVNRVNPGGAAQSAHRDYHLGFMTVDRALEYPALCHELSPLMTLQGGIAHGDTPLESGPTMFLPYSQNFSHGYVLFSTPEYQEIFQQHHVQVPFGKGDAVFFNPALMHAAGANRSKDILRTVNLLQVSSAFGRAIETVDRVKSAKALYPSLLAAKAAGKLDPFGLQNAINACAEGYPFPTNLDLDPPVGGLVPKSQAAFMLEAIEAGMDANLFGTELDKMAAKRMS